MERAARAGTAVYTCAMAKYSYGTRESDIRDHHGGGAGNLQTRHSAHSALGQPKSPSRSPTTPPRPTPPTAPPTSPPDQSSSSPRSSPPSRRLSPWPQQPPNPSPPQPCSPQTPTSPPQQVPRTLRTPRASPIAAPAPAQARGGPHTTPRRRHAARRSSAG